MDSVTFTTNPAAKRLGKRIHARRTSLGLTQDALAETSHVSQGTISRVERGEMMPSVTTLVRLRDALGLPPDEFAAWLEAVQ